MVNICWLQNRRAIEIGCAQRKLDSVDVRDTQARSATGRRPPTAGYRCGFALSSASMTEISLPTASATGAGRAAIGSTGVAAAPAGAADR